MLKTGRLLVGCGIGVMAGLVAGLAQVDRITGAPFATRSEVIAPHGMVAASHPLAAQVGLDVLKAGGSAVDAAIATNAALGLMEPVGNGVGGDLFAIVWDAKTQRLYGLNGSGRSPLGLSYDQMREELAKLDRDTIPPFGVLPISVPGTVDAWYELHGKFGKLPMARLLAPTITYAEEGFPLSELIAFYWDRNVRYFEDLPGAAFATWAPGGAAPKKGEIFKNPDLARTLRRIAEGGRDIFYRGAIADEIDAFMREHGGYLRKADLEAHTSTWVTPVSVNYRGYDVFELPPNGQGIAALQMLQILEGYDLAAMGRNSPEALHVMIEAKKLAFEDRAKFYADPDFSDIPLEWLLSDDYAAERRALIDPARAAARVEAGNPALEEGDTIYLTTADAEGNMVSLIQSNYRGMGAGIMVPGLGFGFQDRGQMFVFEPRDHANVYAPGKRPFHTIIPAFIMKDGKPWVSFGLMGGAMQPQGHVQIVTNLIDFGLNLQEAGDAARWQHGGSTDYDTPQMTDGGYVYFETGIPWETLRALKLKRHDVRTDLGGYGGYQAIMWDAENEVYIGASESRKDGHAVGY
ncbi:gamma-glutamyltransferase [Actomonas aquatica]|uniref:Glutathione hydrolase proenzyme n=1 Tax=Actomonas aquatica TaxID=2866162 RepID=A0ABZ1C445_9BACT|nr:gamma-glutamyltransferase [Opitutus sp. WL0086]WRQ86365.1 gamma-glutamyltransferase [Opitutus sp. WL0086]